MDIFMRLLHIFEGRLFDNPKKAAIIISIGFIIVMIIGVSITQVHTASHQNQNAVTLATSTPIMSSADHFNLKEIIDYPPTPTPTATLPASLDTASSVAVGSEATATPFVCEPDPSRDAPNVGKYAKIAYLGGYPVEINLRYRHTDPNIIVGKVSSGTKVYIIDGPQCLQGVRWFKVNSAKDRTVGWIPSYINGKPTMEEVSEK